MGQGQRSAEPGAGPGSGQTPGPGPAVTPRPSFTPEPTPALVARPSGKVTIRGARVTRYAVEGDTASELLAAMAEHGPAGGDEPGLDILAQARVRYTTHWRELGSGASCRVVSASVTARYRVILPRWTAPAMVPADIAEWWGGALGYLRWHEVQHVRIWRHWFAEFDDRVVGRRCSDVGAISRRWKAQMQAAHDAFHASAEVERRDDALDPWRVGVD